MKSICFNIRRAFGFFSGLFILASTLGLESCKEEIDESNFAIKSEDTAADFIAKEGYTMAQSIFESVNPGIEQTSGASSIYTVLGTRGNYTIFLPSNEAVQAYLGQYDVTLEDFIQLPQYKDLKVLVAQSCIIPNNDDNAYETHDFPINGVLPKTTMNDRLLSHSEDSLNRHVINQKSTIVRENIKVSNGVIHVVDSVIAPSMLTLDSLINLGSNTQIFAALLKKTKFDAVLMQSNLDIKYEQVHLESPTKQPGLQARGGELYYPEHRYLGHTVFVETDDIFASELGIAPVYKENAEGKKVLDNVEDYISRISEKASQVYKASTGNPTQPSDALNQFVAYHIIKCKVGYDQFVHHFNEYGYAFGNPKSPDKKNMPTNVWDYYETYGDKYRGLLQVTQVGDAGFELDKDHKFYLNRKSIYNTDPEKGDYSELSVESKGILISQYNAGNIQDAVNGVYYPINSILFNTEEWKNQLFNTRIRFDVSTILTELVTNGVRGGEFNRKFTDDYFESIINVSPETDLLYLMSLGHDGWKDYQGDEFMVCGSYDFVLRLPPVPKAGTYEIRMGVSHNSKRGMCQIYFGDDPNHLNPTGLPYDMRQKAEPNGGNPAIPWFADVKDDWDTNRENDKNMRNQGYMKGPKYFTVTNGAPDKDVRNISGSAAIRRIVTTAEMTPEKTYYLRFKTALDKPDSQFFMDYFEYASTMVYNGVEAEDIW